MVQFDFSDSSKSQAGFTPPPISNLLIFNKSVFVYKLWHDWLKNFPKHSRYALGSRVDQIFLNLLELLFAASYLPRCKKLELVDKSISKIDLIKFYLRLCWEMKLLNDNKFQIMAVKMEEIGRLAWAWKNNLEKIPPPEARARK